MSYQITIKQTVTRKKIVNNAWGVIGYEEVGRDERYTHDKDEPRTRIQEIHGYLPPIETEVSEDVEVLKQTVESLDLTVVICAINKIKPTV